MSIFSNRTARAILTALALLASTAAAHAQDDEEDLNRSTEKVDFVSHLPDRPTLVGDRLLWKNHALADLCSELKGSFRKLAGRSEYMCRLPARASTASVQIGPKE
jgi:hypothetical protein